MPEGEQMFKYHGLSGPCPKPPLPKSVEEVGWCIVRYIGSGLTYWNGRFLDSSRGFETDNLKAIRFARQEDASIVLSWLLGNEGAAQEHMWVCP